MKIWNFFASILLFSVLFAACNDDDLQPDDNILNYDGDNVTSPVLDPGTYELAVRFTQDELDPIRDKKLAGVQFFMGVRPATLKVFVSGPGSNNEPGNFLFEQDLTNIATGQGGLQLGAFNELRIDPPLDLPDTEMWLSVEFQMDETNQNIGCDSGPADPNGDYIYDSNKGIWETFRARTNGSESVNWNIRGILE